MRYSLLLLILFSQLAFAGIGKISSFKGSIQIQRGSENIKATLGLDIEKKDIINTRNNSNIIIKFKDNTIVTVGKNSTLIIEEYIYDTNNTKKSKTSFNFSRGTFKSITGIIGKIHPEKFKLHTKTANIGIRGTTIIGNQEIIACTSGEIEVQTKNKNLKVLENQYTYTTPKKISNIPLALNDEILEVLYKGLAMDLYNKNDSDENNKINLLINTLEKATVNVKKITEGNNTKGQSKDVAGDPGP